MDHTQQCYSASEGQKIFNVLKPLMEKCEKVEVSFKGIDTVASSFVNAAFVDLLQHFSFHHIRSHLLFVDSFRHINDLIKKRFYFEAGRTDALRYAQPQCNLPCCKR